MMRSGWAHLATLALAAALVVALAAASLAVIVTTHAVTPPLLQHA
ncbi:hypothetical protein [Pseudoduganella armeniaca]|nr:hypothetical protein [Pseudoduganella armeniaca]